VPQRRAVAGQRTAVTRPAEPRLACGAREETGRNATNRELVIKTRTDHRVPITSVFLLLVVLAFSDEFLSAVVDAIGVQQDVRWLVAPIDFILLLTVLIQKRSFRRKVKGQRRIGVLLWWFFGAALTIGVDVVGVLVRAHPIWFDLLSYLVYVFALALLLAATVDANPWMFVSAGRRSARPAEWIRVRGAVPLLVGTLGAYLATAWWEFWLSKQGIEREFFAQMSQVIALLIVALGVEVQFFRSAATDPSQRAMAVLSLSILALGEVMSLSALTVKRSYLWHDYLAFIITAEACLVALSTLIWVLIVRLESSSPAPPPVSAIATPPPPTREAAPPPEPRGAMVAAGLGLVAVAALSGLARVRRRNRDS
jgi:hypothetical protein